ncbi:MAG: DNA double-strand break repair nuclease NurA [Candidatus Hydrothermarchaeales archaeon]
MLDLTYEVLAKKKPEIKKRIDKLLDTAILKRYGKEWREVDVKPSEARVGGEDGSINHRRYKNLVVYAVNAAALVYDTKIKKKAHADVGILYPYYQIEERLHLYRAIFELKASLEVMDDVELFLMDGSLLSDLKVLRTLEVGLSKAAKEEVLSLLPEIEKAEGVKIASIELSKELGKEDFKEKVGFLEYVEYLSCLEKLISRGIDKIAGISKLSTRSIFGNGIPDLAIFEEVTSKAGFSKPKQDFVSKKFPVYDEFFRSLIFTITNIRLEDRKDVFMLEVPREVDEDEVVSVMEKIRSVSVDGYPYLLQKAHKDVVIKNSDMEKIVSGLGIVEKTGREMLK